MLEFHFEVEGADKIKDFLRNFPEKTKKACNDAIKSSVILVEREAKLRSPVDTGLMRSSIQHKVYENQMAGETYVGVKYAIMFHAPYFRKPRRGGVGETNFLPNAVNAVSETINKFFEQALKKIIE